MAKEPTLKTVQISSKSHLNLTFNLNQCGEGEISGEGALRIAEDSAFMLVCLSEGAAVLETSGMIFHMQAPQGFFSFPDLAYELRAAEGETVRITWLYFSGYRVESYLNRANISRSHPVFPDARREVLERMQKLYQASQRLPNRYCRMMSIMYDIFSLLLGRDHASAKAQRYVDDANVYAVRAAEYIERHYASNLSVNDLAMAIGVSRKRLYSVFDEIMHISPKQYLILYRIERACLRLHLSTQSIEEIAESVGYSNQFYFAKEFKRMMGVTPSEYRKNPGDGDVLSYRTFLPTLQDHLGTPDPLPAKKILPVAPAWRRKTENRK
ncbi:MAG: AraC family transcriptional regulator [Eubacteriales bacterium]|nr:AraC family transcriptional regulator [Eubacteriales bacterium]